MFNQTGYTSMWLIYIYSVGEMKVSDYGRNFQNFKSLAIEYKPCYWGLKTSKGEGAYVQDGFRYRQGLEHALALTDSVILAAWL